MDSIELVTVSNEAVPLDDELNLDEMNFLNDEESPLFKKEKQSEPRTLLVTRFDDQYEIVDLLRGEASVDQIAKINFVPPFESRSCCEIITELITPAFWFAACCMVPCAWLSSRLCCGRGGRKYSATELISVPFVHEL